MKSSPALQRHAITFKSNGGLMRVLHTPVYIATPNGPNKEFRGIWDTGASATVITQKVVDDLNLKPIGITKVNTASERDFQTYQFLIDIYLKQDLVIKDVMVTLGKLTDDFHCLIGMDIISLGDFSITNFNQRTIMSFRVPSSHEIDFVENPHYGASPFTDVTPSRNQLCPCGSGRLYKRCHGKNK